MDFPRGSTISRSAIKKPSNNARKRSVSQKKHKKSIDENEALTLLRHQISTSTEIPFVDTLSKKKLQSGMLLLGIVTEISTNNDRSMKIQVSLPHGMSTAIIIPPTLDFHSVAVSNGDKIRVAYHDDGSSSSFTLSPEFTQPNLAQQFQVLDHGISLQSTSLSAIVKSIEDHGYLLSFGSHVPLSIVGFLPFKDIDPNSSTYSIGTLLPNVFLSGSITKQDKLVVPCTLSPSHQRILPSTIPFFDFDFFIPGMLLSGLIVRNISNRGYVLSILSGTYYAILDLIHCREQYDIGKEITARILYTCTERKIIGLTVLQHLDYKNTLLESNRPAIGQLIDSKVIRVDQFYGLLMHSNSDNDSNIFSQYLHITKLGKKIINDQDFPKGTILQVCVSRIDHCDGLVQVCQYDNNNDSSILLGTMVKGIVTIITPKSVIVKISGTKMMGICPKFHWSESNNNSCTMQKDKKYRFRVLSYIDGSSKDDHNEHIGKVLLTRKISMIDSLFPPLYSPEQLCPILKNTPFYDAGTHGFVVATKDDGVIVAFYGSMKGYLPKSQIISNPLELGAVVHVRIVQCIDMQSGKYILTMLPRKTSEHDNSEKKKVTNIEHNTFADELEKQLLSEPNNPALWIKYMSEWTSRGDLIKARSIANRSLQTLPYHEEKDRLLIWSAWLHMEWHVMLGTFGNIVNEASKLDDVIKDSLQRAHEKRILLILWDMYWKTFMSEKSLARERIQSLIPIMLSKLKQSCKVHIFIWNYYANDNLLEADKQYHTSCAVLSNYPGKQIKYSTKIACSAYRFEQKERGRTIFETLISQHPKRFDIWIVYLQAEESSDMNYTRRLYERALGLRFSSKKMKTLFKMYLSYEKLHGNQKGVDHVQDLIRQYIDSDIGAL